MCVDKSKIPEPKAVIERQAYKQATPRDSIGADDSADRRRRMAGVQTSPSGVTQPASTTKRVRAGGDAPMLPTIGGGGADSVIRPAPGSAPPGTGGGAAAPIIQALAARGYVDPRQRRVAL